MTISIQNEHFFLNKILLLAVGLWPYNRSKLVDFHLFVFHSILISFIMFQFTTFLTAEFTFDLAIKIFSFTLFCSMFLIEYSACYINAHTIRILLENLQHVCNELKDDGEIAIFRHYGKNAKQFTTVIVLFTIWNLIHHVLLPMYIRVYGIMINTSQSDFTMHVMYILLQVTEYFVDPEKYFYFILLHMNAAVCIGGIAMIATGTLLVGCTKHVCGMLKIASYRIEQATAIPMLQNCGLSKYSVHRHIVHAVDIHRKGMELFNILLSNFTGSFCTLILVGVICLSLNFYGLFRAMMLRKSLAEPVAHFTCVIVVLMYMFLANYAGQEITDHYNLIFINVYNVEWYITPIYIQKIILFLLQRGTKTFNVVLGKLFVVSIESAAMLISTSISYFTVLYSTWQSV